MLTVLNDGQSTSVPATIRDGRAFLSPEAVEQATGWTPKPEGLCRAEACIPLRDATIFDDAGGLALDGVAAALRRPLAIELDDAVAVAVIGEAAADRAAAMASGKAPAFDIEGVLGGRVTLDQFAGQKRLLHAWASW